MGVGQIIHPDTVQGDAITGITTEHLTIAAIQAVIVVAAKHHVIAGIAIQRVIAGTAIQ